MRHITLIISAIVLSVSGVLAQDSCRMMLPAERLEAPADIAADTMPVAADAVVDTAGFGTIKNVEPRKGLYHGLLIISTTPTNQKRTSLSISAL